jgi:hypothetical protein
LENSCNDRGDRWHTFGCRDSIAKQEVRNAGVTGNNAEFCHSERSSRNFNREPRRKLSLTKPANYASDRFNAKSWTRPRNS